MFLIRLGGSVMKKPTGQMQEETQELLDHYNNLYNWDYNEMCHFIENYSEEEFRKYYDCLLYTSPSPRDGLLSRMPSSA